MIPSRVHKIIKREKPVEIPTSQIDIATTDLQPKGIDCIVVNRAWEYDILTKFSPIGRIPDGALFKHPKGNLLIIVNEPDGNSKLPKIDGTVELPYKNEKDKVQFRKMQLSELRETEWHVATNHYIHTGRASEPLIEVHVNGNGKAQHDSLNSTVPLNEFLDESLDFAAHADLSAMSPYEFGADLQQAAYKRLRSKRGADKAMERMRGSLAWLIPVLVAGIVILTALSGGS